MKLFRGLPIYKVTIDDDYENTDQSANLGMKVVSLVDDPAVSSDFLLFENEEEKPKQLKFSIKQEERIITGCAIRANYPIYRNGGISGKPYYVVFQREDIKKIVQQFSRKNYFNNTSLQHDGTPLKGVYLTEMYIKDWSRGIAPIEFENIEDGSLFMSYKIDDDELWEKIKNGNDINGFSIEIESYLDIIDDAADEFSNEQPDELEEFVNSIFNEEEDKKKSELDFVHVSSVTQAIEQNKEVLLDADGKKHKCQILEVGKANGKQYAVYYDCVDNEWRMKDIKDIDSIKITNKPIQRDWDRLMKEEGYGEILKRLDEQDIAVKKVATSPKELIYQAIDDGLYVMINYNDEQPNPHTGARQCKIVAYGLTHRGNECIRVFQDFGDSRSKHEPRFRLMLTKRIMSMRPMPEVERWNITDLDETFYNPDGDESMFPPIKWRDR